MTSDSKSRRQQRRAQAAAATTRARQRRASGGLRDALTLDDEQRTRLLIIGAVVGVVLIAVGFIAFGYWYSVVKPRNRTVLQIGNERVSYSAMKRRMGYEYFQNITYQQSQSGFALLPRAAYEALADELTKVTQAEPRLGLTLSAAEEDTKLRSKVGAAEGTDQRVFADDFRRALDTSGLSESEYRRLVRAEALDDKITAKMTADLPLQVEQARIEVIQATAKEDAQAAIDRINAGEDFATVAKEVSKESDVASTGGTHDYQPKDAVPAPYADFAFSSAAGVLSTPLSTSDAGPFYAVRVVDRSNQPVQDTQKAKLASAAATKWLTDTRADLEANGEIINKWDTKSQNDALLAILGDVAAKQQQQQRQQQEQQQQAQEAQATAAALQTANAGTPPAGETPGAGTPAAETPAGGASPPAGDATQPAATSPVVPSQPVVPGSNGQ